MNEEKFLSWQFANKPDDLYIIIWTKDPVTQRKVSKWFKDPEAATEYALSAELDGVDVYFGLAIHPCALAPYKRGDAKDMAGIVCLWADIDVFGPHHIEQNLPPTKEAALALLEEIPLEPTFIVWSGGGIHAYWQLVEPWIFSSDEDRREAGKLVADWLQTIRAHANQHGWKVDAVADLARVLRVPGTLNHKSDPPVPVEIIKNSERAYNLSDFEPFLFDDAASQSLLPFNPILRDASQAIVGGCLSDDELLEKARSAMNGDKFRALFDAGDLSGYSGDASRADRALAGYLAFWTGKNLAVMDRLFRRSRLFRKKYDEKHYGSGETYGQHLLQKAIDECQTVYTPGEVTMSADEINDIINSYRDDPSTLNNFSKVGKRANRRLLIHAIKRLDGREKANKALKTAAAPLIEKFEEDEQATQSINIEEETGLPVINYGHPFRQCCDETMRALDKVNNPPVLFQREKDLVRLRIIDDHPSIDKLDIPMLTHYVSRAANIMLETSRGRLKNIPPPNILISVLLGAPEYPFPLLQGVVECPVLRPDGSLLMRPGYDNDTKLFYQPAPGLHLPAIPMNPTLREVNAAKALLTEMVCDFPFVDWGEASGQRNANHSQLCTSSFANYLGFFLTSLIRHTLDCSVPLCLINGTKQGSGKGRLVEIASLVATGDTIHPTPLPTTEEELEKKMLAMLMAGRTFILFDNITHRIESGVLCSVLTSRKWSTRVLGRNTEVPIVPNIATWAATGNNIQLGRDISRRAYFVHLDAKSSTPWEREDFRHPELLPWVKAHRGELLAAAFTLIRAWYAAGCPQTTVKTMGNFEAWVKTIAGILAHVEVPGFLADREASLDRCDPDESGWAGFLFELARLCSDRGRERIRPILASELALSLVGSTRLHEVLPNALAIALDGTSASVVLKIGNVLASVKNTRFGPYGLFIEQAGKKRNPAKWRVSADDTIRLMTALGEENNDN